MHAGAAGIGEEIQEVLALAHLAQHAAGDTVVEEQAGIQIVGQVDPQAGVIFAHFDKVALLAHLLVLIFTFLTFTGFQHQLVWRNTQHGDGGGNNVQHALTRFLRINGFRRRIFLNHHPVRVAVNRHVVLRQVGIIQAVAFNALLLRPLLKFLQVLAQTVSVIFRHAGRLAVGRFLRQMVVFLHAVQRAVFRLKLAVGTQLQAAQQFRRGAEHRQVPAAKLTFHDPAQQAVQGDQRRLAFQTLAVRRVADHGAVRAFRQRVIQLGDVFDCKIDQLADAGPAGVAARALNDALVDVRAIEARPIGRQPLAGAGLRFRLHLFPDSVIVLRPTAKAPVAAVQTRRTIGRQHRRFNQQGTGAAHRIEQWRTRYPTRAHDDRRREVFFDRRHTGTIAVAAQMQPFPAQIQGDMRRLFVQPDVDPQIGRLTIDIRARQVFTREAVDDGVFDF